MLLNSRVKQCYSHKPDRYAILINLVTYQWFSTVNISSAFTCIRSAHLQSYSGFRHSGHYYELQRIPFGFHNSMHVFLNAMDYTLCKVRQCLQIVAPEAILMDYLDDLALGTKDRSSHLLALKISFEALEEDVWTVHFTKCHFL